MQIAIPDEVTDTLRAKARAVNLDVAEYAIQILREQLIQPNPPQLSLIESELLQLINHGFADDVWQRFHELNEKRKDELLTQQEHEELIALSDEMEIANAERVAALAELAKLRQVTIEALMRSLGIQPAEYV